MLAGGWVWRRKRLLTDPKRLGRWGQQRSEQYLRRRGYRTIQRNYRSKAGEIDLIMDDNGTRLVFVEVKTRSREDYYAAQDAVNKTKQTHIGRVARDFLRMYNAQDLPVRYDIVAVVLEETGRPEIRHYPAAFIP